MLMLFAEKISRYLEKCQRSASACRDKGPLSTRRKGSEDGQRHARVCWGPSGNRYPAHSEGEINMTGLGLGLMFSFLAMFRGC